MKLARALALAPLQIAQALAGLGAIAVFTRLLSAEEFGQYALALSASMLGHTLLFTWAEAAAFRFLPAARVEGRTADHFATLLATALALGVGALILTAVLLAFSGLSEDLVALSAFAAGAATLRFFVRIARETDRASFSVGRYAVLETLYLLIGFAAGVALLMHFNLGAAAPFAGLLAAGVLVLLIDLPHLTPRSCGGAPSLVRAATYAGYGAPLALALAIDLGVQTVARIILAAEAGAGEVGAYAAAFGLARPLDLIFIAAGAALSPLLLSTYEGQGADAIRAPARNGAALMAAIALPAALGIALVAAPLSALLVGQALSAEAARALPWLALAGLASGVNLYYLSEAFQLTRRTGLRALVMLAPGAVQLALTLALTGAHGATGAAIAAAAGAAAGSVLLIVVGRRLIALPLPLAAFARAAAATCAMALAVIAIPNSDLLLKVAAGAATYVITALALDVAGVRAILLVSLARLWPRRLLAPEQTHAAR